jgi:hypothetical protein
MSLRISPRSWKSLLVGVVMIAAVPFLLLARGAEAAPAAVAISGEFTQEFGDPNLGYPTGDLAGTVTFPRSSRSRATRATFEGTVLGSEPGTIELLLVYASQCCGPGRLVTVPGTGTGGLEGVFFSVSTTLSPPFIGDGTYEGTAIVP